MAAAFWTRTTFALFVLFWILQFAAVVSHISFITIWIGFLGVRSNVDLVAYIYTALAISTFFYLGLLITELIFYLRSCLSLERYHKLQRIKIRIAFIEMLALGIICHGVEDLTGVVWRVLVFTACAGIPFSFSLGLASFMKRTERKKLEMATKEVDEETPLLNGR